MVFFFSSTLNNSSVDTFLSCTVMASRKNPFLLQPKGAKKYPNAFYFGTVVWPVTTFGGKNATKKFSKENTTIFFNFFFIFPLGLDEVIIGSDCYCYNIVTANR